jgi:hypothetical protein
MSSFWADILMHSAFFIGFLPMFYFTYVCPVQSNSLANDFFGLLKDTLAPAQKIANPNVKREIDEAVEKSANLLEESGALDSLNSGNPGVFRNTMIVLGVALPVLIGTSIMLQTMADGSLWDLFIGNVIVLAFIAISEFAIVGIFIANFVEIDRDFAKSILIKQTLSNADTAFNDCRFTHEFAFQAFGPLAKFFLKPVPHYTNPEFLN